VRPAIAQSGERDRKRALKGALGRHFVCVEGGVADAPALATVFVFTETLVLAQDSE
jgi:hypothetical protein